MSDAEGHGSRGLSLKVRTCRDAHGFASGMRDGQLACASSHSMTRSAPQSETLGTACGSVAAAGPTVLPVREMGGSDIAGALAKPTTNFLFRRLFRLNLGGPERPPHHHHIFLFVLPFTAAFYARARARAHNLRYRARASAQVKHHAVHQSPAGQRHRTQPHCAAVSLQEARGVPSRSSR
jgi:hypothetical protein